MGKTIDDYIANLDGWQAEVAAALRADALAVSGITETFKWGQPVFESAYGPVCLIKANKAKVSLGFWRGQQMADLDGRRTPSATSRWPTSSSTAPTRSAVPKCAAWSRPASVSTSNTAIPSPISSDRSVPCLQ